MGFWTGIGSALTGGLLSAGSSAYTSQQNIKAEREARRWNEMMWREQNKYNHPSAQMARLQEAGLNPRLVYGGSPSGTTGQAGSVAPAKAPRLDYNVGDPIAAYQSAKMVSAQTQNLDAMKRLNDAKAISEMYKGKVGEVNWEAIRNAKDVVMKGIVDQYQTLSANLEKALAEANVAKGTQAARIAQATETLNNMVKDGELKSLDAVYKKFVADLSEQGFTVGDNKWTRALITQLEKSGAIDELNKFASHLIKDPIKYFSNMLLKDVIIPFKN